MGPSRNQPHSSPPRVVTCGTVLITNQFSIFIRGLQFIHTFYDRAFFLESTKYVRS